MSKFLPTKLYTTAAEKVESLELEIPDPEIIEGELAIQGAKLTAAKNLPKCACGSQVCSVCNHI